MIERSETTFLKSFAKPEEIAQWLVENASEKVLAFVGRSNVGKSTLINALFKNKVAFTSNTPGRTREINLFRFTLEKNEQPYYFLDLPGYGHAKLSQEQKRSWNQLMGVFFQNLPATFLLVMIQDARHPYQKSDQQFQEFVKSFQGSSLLIFNKIDKLKRQKERAALNKLKPFLFEQYKKVKTIHFISAEKRQDLGPLKLDLQSYLQASFSHDG